MSVPKIVRAPKPIVARLLSRSPSSRTVLPRFSLRLVRLTAVVALMLTVIGAMLAWREYRTRREQETQHALTLTRAAAADAERFVQDRIALLQTIARSPAVQDADPDALHSYLAGEQAAQPGVADILWIDPQGVIRVHALSTPLESSSVADRDYFQAVRATGQPFVSAALIGRVTNRPLVVVAVPTRDAGGRVTGVLSAGITLEQLEATLTQFQTEGESTLLVVDRDGQLVVDARPGAAITDVSASALLRRARDERQGVVERSTGIRGDPGRLTAFADVPTGGWLVFVERSADAVIAPARHELFTTLAALAMLLVVGVGGVALTGRELDRVAAAQRQALNDAVAENTERRRAEEALRLSEQRFRSLVQNVSDIVVVIDPDGTLRYVSPSVERILGYRPETWVGRNALEVVHPEDQDRLRQALERVAQVPGIHRPIHFRLRSARGSWREMEATANNLLDDPSVGGIVETVRDITERQRYLEALRFLDQAGTVLSSSLDYERTLAQVARLAVPMLADWCAVDMADEDGVIRRVAVAAADPVREQAVQDLRARYPHTPDWPTGVPRVLRTGEPELIRDVTDEQLAEGAVDEEHLRLVRALGMRSILRVPLVTGGRAVGVISLIMAESGRRYNTASLRVAQALAHRSAIAIDNARLYDEARAALALRDEFLASISHDLRTPLTSIKSYSQFLLRRLQSSRLDDAHIVVESLATIDDSASKMSALVGQLLDLSRLQAGRPLELNRRPLDLVDLVSREVGWLRKRATHLEIVMSAGLPELTGRWDADRLERVVANLLTNAAKYSPQGGTIRVTVARDEDETGAWAVVTVEDRGIGIPAADLPRVFERFHRGANVGTIAGTGVGLAGVKQIVEQHGGAIMVASTEGEGTTVTVRLPLAEERGLRTED